MPARRVEANSVANIAVDHEVPDTDYLSPGSSTEAALTAWKEERYAFYRDDLRVSEETIAAVDAVVEDFGTQVRQIVERMEDAEPDQHDQDDLQLQLVQRLKLLDDRVFEMLGPDRYDQIVAFRSRFNLAVKERFDTDLKFTAF